MNYRDHTNNPSFAYSYYPMDIGFSAGGQYQDDVICPKDNENPDTVDREAICAQDKRYAGGYGQLPDASCLRAKSGDVCYVSCATPEDQDYQIQGSPDTVYMSYQC